GSTEVDPTRSFFEGVMSQSRTERKRNSRGHGSTRSGRFVALALGVGVALSMGLAQPTASIGQASAPTPAPAPAPGTTPAPAPGTPTAPGATPAEPGAPGQEPGPGPRRVADLTTRYRFIENYAPNTDLNNPEVIVQERVGILETIRIETENPRGAPDRKEITA